MIDFQKLANEFGTPLYVYDAQKIRKRIAKAKKVFEGLDAEIVFALKANNNPSLLKIMAEDGNRRRRCVQGRATRVQNGRDEANPLER